jgi:hypothetical protein
MTSGAAAGGAADVAAFDKYLGFSSFLMMCRVLMHLPLA